MLLSIFTLFHVLISLVGIASGFVVLSGFLTSKRFDGWTAVFLTTTVATSVTGFLFPFHGLTPGYVLGVISLVVLGIAIAARYRFHLAGGWRKTYVITAAFAQYMNVFVLVAQMFQKIGPLKALAPTQSAPPFAIAQGAVLLLFVAFTIRAAMKFHGEPLGAMKSAAFGAH